MLYASARIEYLQPFPILHTKKNTFPNHNCMDQGNKNITGCQFYHLAISHLWEGCTYGQQRVETQRSTEMLELLSDRDVGVVPHQVSSSCLSSGPLLHGVHGLLLQDIWALVVPIMMLFSSISSFSFFSFCSVCWYSWCSSSLWSRTKGSPSHPVPLEKFTKGSISSNQIFPHKFLFMAGGCLNKINP